jgi:hypothetical protein
MTSTKADPSSLKKTEDGVTIKVEGQDSEERSRPRCCSSPSAA